MRNYRASGAQSNLQILVSTDDPSPVSFIVTRFLGGTTTTTHTATYGSITKVELSAETFQVIFSSNSSERNKHIIVQAEAGKSISVYGVNDENTTTDAFFALSCDGMTIKNTFSKYEYIIVSGNFGYSDPINSEFLIVPCESRSNLEICPTQRITFNFGTGTKQIAPGRCRTVLLNNLGSFLISHRSDLTGTIVRSDQPLTIISGHECAQVPNTRTACDHLAEQIPPQTTWGTTYFLSPLAARESGDIYRVASTYDNNQITVTCINKSSSTTETLLSTSLSRGNWREFNTNSFESSCPGFVPKYCCLAATKPVLVAQYSQGHTVDAKCTGDVGTDLGDPFMIIVPPVVQYINNLTITAVEGVTGRFLTRFINIAVHKMFFQPDMIYLDDQLVESNRNQWNPFYCSNGEICGYGLSKAIPAGDHTIYHEMESAALGVTVYGFQQQNSYGYTLGMELQPISGIYIGAFVVLN